MSQLISKTLSTDGTCIVTLATGPGYSAIASETGKIYIIDHTTLDVSSFQAHTRSIWALYCTEDIIVSGASDAEVRVWDARTLAQGADRRRIPLRMFTGHTATIRCLQVFDDGKALISGSRDGSLRIWRLDDHDAEAETEVTVLRGHPGTVRHVRVCGDIAVSGGYDGEVRVWDIRAGRCLHVLRGHETVFALEFDGRRIVSAGKGGDIRVWDAASGELVRVLSGHQDIVTRLAVVHDGQELVSAGLDGLLKVWALDGTSVRDIGPARRANVRDMAVQGEYVLLARSGTILSMLDVTSGVPVEGLDATVGETIWQVGFVGDSPMVVYYQEGRAMVNIYRQA